VAEEEAEKPKSNSHTRQKEREQFKIKEMSEIIRTIHDVNVLHEK